MKPGKIDYAGRNENSFTRKNMICLFAMMIMVIISLSALWGRAIGGVSVLVGIIFFFMSGDSTRSVLKVKDIRMKLKRHIIWILLPLIMNVICISLAFLIVPQFIEHIGDRTEVMLSFDQMFLLILQLAILAIGEELAWRGFFQKQMGTWLPMIPTLILTSLLFTIGHFAVGPFWVVSYDLVFIFINSILYGYVFYRTNTIWISAISHFLANLFGIVLLSFLG
ncbi:CPBP family intramembrane glutamic endopeptidase [Sporosarcina sp. Te-1]|uniref:CPBP family intramembrane glutamic endopeptidase n=1 Tax=Sporosarcina sp. Te-1 TaxID=2818390 RepID=UPI001A9F339B|nr:type II CAAX endopeptidase family protein [Sporosarcina sp. Te-1]QTD41979.1 CPBP family intramembrane metalloprotease [Sporosarcina sp. Te-1]